ncbi:MAG: hypothetical protein NAG76_08340 [Candidatus Pristimantibacillus lignocellulolyticus]|uniref:Uncharacterized protein n=1 Tax=Candidatus Pristimantibacillus lignocellulolyticus TaxID=2994561 RepID=A0A9J6ZJN1_9BACL|nr:MAG: hypothetical protein NAG76_08340 [Candidatus Pristimantibacillus lignocellulolyticus]
MKKIIKLLKESIWDLMKDSIKPIISSAIIALFAIVISMMKNISNIEMKIRLPYIIFAGAIFTIMTIIIVVVLKSLVNLKIMNNELLNPENENVKKFQLGDIVIIKTEEHSKTPEMLTVAKITSSSIHCRYPSDKTKIIEFTPEELLTKDETEEVKQKIQINKLQQDQARRARNQRQRDMINSFNRL